MDDDTFRKELKARIRHRDQVALETFLMWLEAGGQMTRQVPLTIEAIVEDYLKWKNR